MTTDEIRVHLAEHEAYGTPRALREILNHIDRIDAALEEVAQVKIDSTALVVADTIVGGTIKM